MTVRIEVTDGVGIVTLDDPERRNALNQDMVRRITDAFDEFELAGSGVAAVVVTGTPPAFCAGADLGHLGANADDDGQGVRMIYEGFLRVARSPLPTIAAVNGAAVGAASTWRWPATCASRRGGPSSSRGSSSSASIPAAATRGCSSGRSATKPPPRWC